jgi:hypothetical protein
MSRSAPRLLTPVGPVSSGTTDWAPAYPGPRRPSMSGTTYVWHDRNASLPGPTCPTSDDGSSPLGRRDLLAQQGAGRRCAGAGPRRYTPTSSTSTKPPRGATSLPGESPSYSRSRSDRHSSRCANDISTVARTTACPRRDTRRLRPSGAHPARPTAGRNDTTAPARPSAVAVLLAEARRPRQGRL